ncbi:hypothetical protein [Mesorhizobium sp. WSM4312]|uniref:hypothetical protein n=1 Tax=Mesorhizobium sp. WSM4312 TaxID=2029411 RepID=UPI0015CA52B4|nr:hypothetical protein [Mesorhizobium sp. WSM4312]
MRHPVSIMAKPVFALAIGAVLAISTALAGDAAAHHRLFARWPLFRLRAVRPAPSGKPAVIVVLGL